MAEVAVSGALALVEILSPFLSQEFNLEHNVQIDISCITSWLHTMEAFLVDKEGYERTQVARDQVRQIRDFAYDIEDIIDDFMYQVPHHFHRHRVTQIAHDLYHFPGKRTALHDLSSRIQDIRKKMDCFRALSQLRVGGTCLGEALSSNRPMTRPPHRTVEEDEVVGFQNLVVQIRSQLLSEEPRRLTVSITGPAGSGKTSLAKKILEDQKAQDVFDFISLVKVSPSFNLEGLLRRVELQLLEQVGNDNPGLIQGTGAVLRRHLEDRKYLIALDDVWKIQDLELILNELPDGLGSRVIVTSRNRKVASFRAHDLCHLHELGELPWKDARNLFCKKAFWRSCGECPLELQEWAEKIVKKCEGLPLALTTVGGLLSNKPQIPVEWKKFHDSIGTDLSIIGSLLPSYNDLRAQPDLKSCFLYFGIFPEDYCIQRERLFRLWIAEGFVKEERNRSVDEVAERNLDDLVNRNLVSVCKRDIDGRVRSCRVLNLVREFIISKAEEGSFVSVLTGRSSPSSDKVRRLSLVDSPTFSPDRNFDRARSAFHFGKANLLPFIAQFKLLRVLDMTGAPLKSFPEEILRLYLLRYLSLQNTQIRSIPRSIKKLSHLEFLDLKQTLITQLPDTIFRLQHLRHLLVYHYEFGSYVTFQGMKGVQIGDGIGTMARIEKLSLIKVNSKIIEELGNLVRLKKLGVIGLKEKHGKRLCESLQKMPDLSTLDVRSDGEDTPLDLDNIPGKPAFEFLQRLYLKGRLRELPRWVSSLQSLIKIKLRWSRMESHSPLEALQNLPNLMDLEMVESYTGNTLEFRAGTFRKLKVLAIERFDRLNTVTVPHSTMPELEKLTIRKCWNMWILPLGIEGLSHLRELVLYDVNEELVDNVKYRDRWMVEHIAVVDVKGSSPLHS